jgi:hypothetical protein
LLPCGAKALPELLGPDVNRYVHRPRVATLVSRQQLWLLIFHLSFQLG